MRCGLFCTVQRREFALIHHNSFSNTRLTNKLGGSFIGTCMPYCYWDIVVEEKVGQINSGRLTGIHCTYICT